MRAFGILLPLVTIGCTGNKNDELVANDLIVEPLSLRFGDVPVGTEASKKITVTNPGPDPIDILSVTLSRGEDADWLIDRGRVSSVSDGKIAEIEIQFTPELEGVASGQVQIRTDYDDMPSVLVEVEGKATPSTLDEDGDGHSPADGDCDDQDDTVHPRAPELCDGRDNDCKGGVPANEADNDNDGYRRCENDCDDGDSDRNPGERDICDANNGDPPTDNDCDGTIEDDLDLDLDGQTVCQGDCDNSESLTYPGATEVCDGVDNDCDGGIDNIDQDNDNHSPCDIGGDCNDLDGTAYPIIVSTGGLSTNNGTAAAPFDSIATALGNLDATCREIVLDTGTYDINPVFVGSGQLTIRGQGSGSTILNAATNDRHLTITTGAEVTLEGLSLESGHPNTNNTSLTSYDGGAIQMSSATLHLEDVIFQGNIAGADGGAIAAASSTLDFVGQVAFIDNRAGDDGGALALDQTTLTDDQVSTQYEGNSAVRGGAIVAQGGTLLIAEASFDDNASSQDGGAIALTGSGAYTLQRNRLWFNVASGAGGAVSLNDVNDSSGHLRNNLFQNNQSGTTGGAIAILGGSTVPVALGVTNNTVVDNDALADGGGIYINAPMGSGLVVWANVIGWSTAQTGLYVETGSGADVLYNSVFATSTLNDLGGEAVGADASNLTNFESFVTWSNDNDPSNDDLHLDSGSQGVDSGPVDSQYDDRDGSQNDRGAYGGPEAL